jgi:hypothetical protein
MPMNGDDVTDDWLSTRSSVFDRDQHDFELAPRSLRAAAGGAEALRRIWVRLPGPGKGLLWAMALRVGARVHPPLGSLVEIVTHVVDSVR